MTDLRSAFYSERAEDLEHLADQTDCPDLRRALLDAAKLFRLKADAGTKIGTTMSDRRHREDAPQEAKPVDGL